MFSFIKSQNCHSDIIWNVQDVESADNWNCFFKFTIKVQTFCTCYVRHGLNSVPELELMVNSNFGIRIAYLKKNGIRIDKFGIGIEVCYKKIKSTN